MQDATPVLKVEHLTYRYGGGASIHNKAFSEPKLLDVTVSFPAGSRVLVAGANGAGKSTLLSIMGGQKMIPRDECKLLGRPVFHDTTLNMDRMYCGDWWRTEFFHNVTIAELIGEDVLNRPRVQKLIDIMQINLSWRINAISDGQRRRCQLLAHFVDEKKVYILDEITTDLDLYAREGLLRFLREETEQRGATIFYATHIFDHLADWATHILYFSKAQVGRCCTMGDLKEYHDFVTQKVRCPLYTLMKEWVFRDYDQPMENHSDESGPAFMPENGQPMLETKNLTYSYLGGKPQLEDVNFTYGRGDRILVAGANGAGKSTLLSILGGRRMIKRGLASILGKDCFNDNSVATEVMYIGDWWRTAFFMNLKIREVLGDKLADSGRCKHLAQVLEVDMDWRINSISDGQRRRCQLLAILGVPRSVYLMDEITSDLDIYAREGILNFLKSESENRGATIFYCTHIFDHLEGWATHVLHMSQGKVVHSTPMQDLNEYQELVKEGNTTPLYSMIRNWIYSEYQADQSQPWRKLENTDDGRRPNLGLAGPFRI